jgi:hypothetical protein
MLQASPLDSPLQPVATPTLPAPAVQPVATLTLPVPSVPPSQLVVPTLAPPTSVPLPATVGPTPTVLGFLPAPTIVNPNDLQSLPIAQPPVSAPAQGVEPTPTASRATGADPGLRATVRLLNYLWLLCGGALLIGGAVAILLLWRRSQQM